LTPTLCGEYRIRDIDPVVVEDHVLFLDEPIPNTKGSGAYPVASPNPTRTRKKLAFGNPKKKPVCRPSLGTCAT